MRIALILMLLSLGILSFGQKTKMQSIEIPGWKVDNGKLVWSKVYFAESGTIEEFIKGFEFMAKNSSAVDLSEKDDNSMIGTFSNLILKFEEFDYNLIDTPFLISRARHSGKIEVEIKEGRYKVTITDVVSFLDTYQKTGSVYKWNEDFLDRKNTIKEEMKETLVLADKNFSVSFDVKSQIKSK